MLPTRIGLASESGSVNFGDLVRVANALSIQVLRDAGPIWSLSATVTALEDPTQFDPGVWPVYIVDQLAPGMGGYHQTEHNQPYAMVLSGNTWSLSASHEVLEMLVDPSGNRLVSAPAVTIIDNEVQDGPGKFEYLVEVCDPSEDASCAYLIDGVLVSDFYTPHYFDPTGSAGARYSFSGKITRPRQVLPNGYLSWFNPAENKLQQVRHFGAPEIVDLGNHAPGNASMTGGRSLRGFVDGKTAPPVPLSRLPHTTPIVRARGERRDFLDTARRTRADHYSAARNRASTSLTATAAALAGRATQDPGPVIAANKAVFQTPGVISVRSGWRFFGNRMTGEKAIIVSAIPSAVPTLAARLTSEIGGVPVEVRPATTMQEMRASRPIEYLGLAEARHELRQPDFADETFIDPDTGRPIAVGTGTTTSLSAFAAARVRKPELNHTGPTGVTLAEVTKPVSLVLHASPDAGWAQLSSFLAGVRQQLVVGMYDFTSAHILTAVESAIKGGKSLTLTLDHPPPNPSRDQTDEETREALEAEIGGALKAAWALTNADPLATSWIYPNAYHIKVAVRDDGVFWLSSGNWNNSNQPEIDLSDPVAAKKIASGHDRDWHVIAASPDLADMFRAYLENDYTVANANNVAPGMAAMGAANPAELSVPSAVVASGRAPRRFFAPKTIKDTIRIQPLLTPDNYQPLVLALIQSAREKFYMQTQYIHPSDRQGDEKHTALINAVKDRISAGCDVRLITSEYQTNDWVEKMVEAGIPGSVLRRQARVHNKGIIVDSKIVMVSSQNWSADGTLRNRDAGLIIYHQEAARYFEEIFLHDWDYLASQVMTG